MPGRDDDFDHLYVVVVAIDRSQRLCVPAYGADGEAVTRLVRALHRQGVYQGTGWIELDNRVEIKFSGTRTGKVAKWVPYKLERIEQGKLKRLVGTMRDAGVRQIVECLVKLHAQLPGSTLADDEVPKVRRLAQQLGLTLPKGF